MSSLLCSWSTTGSVPGTCVSSVSCVWCGAVYGVMGGNPCTHEVFSCRQYAASNEQQSLGFLGQITNMVSLLVYSSPSSITSSSTSSSPFPPPSHLLLFPPLLLPLSLLRSLLLLLVLIGTLFFLPSGEQYVGSFRGSTSRGENW